MTWKHGANSFGDLSGDLFIRSLRYAAGNAGRLKVGANADIAIFDANRVVDKATFEKPGQYSEGFRYAMVGGAFVVREGHLEDNVAPGAPIRAVR